MSKHCSPGLWFSSVGCVMFLLDDGQRWASGIQLTINTIDWRSIKSADDQYDQLSRIQQHFFKHCKNCSVLFYLNWRRFEGHNRNVKMIITTQSPCSTFAPGTYSPGLQIFHTIREHMDFDFNNILQFKEWLIEKAVSASTRGNQ